MNGIQCKGPSELLVNQCLCVYMHAFMDMHVCFTEGVCVRNHEASGQG